MTRLAPLGLALLVALLARRGPAGDARGWPVRRWLGPSLAALALMAGACWLAWPAPAFHCGCASVQCELPCVDCCTGATPSGCPLPSAGDVLEIPPPTPEDELVRSGRGALHFPEPIPGGCGPGAR